MTQRYSTALDLRIFLHFDGIFPIVVFNAAELAYSLQTSLNNYSSEIPCCVLFFFFFSDRCTDKFPVLGCILWYADFSTSQHTRPEK